jgi:hypothetical protein
VWLDGHVLVAQSRIVANCDFLCQSGSLSKHHTTPRPELVVSVGVISTQVKGSSCRGLLALAPNVSEGDRLVASRKLLDYRAHRLISVLLWSVLDILAPATPTLLWSSLLLLRVCCSLLLPMYLHPPPSLFGWLPPPPPFHHHRSSGQNICSAVRIDRDSGKGKGAFPTRSVRPRVERHAL